MANKSKFLKSVLTSVSVAAIVSSAGSAYAAANAAQKETTNNADLSGAGNLQLTGIVGAVNWVATNHLKINTGHTVTTGGAAQISSIEVAANPGVFTVAGNTTIGSIFGGAKQLDITFGGGYTLDLDGTAGFNNLAAANTYAALKTIDFANQAATLTIKGNTQGTAAAPVVIGADFKSTGGDKGSIVVDNAYVSFTGTFAAAGTSVEDFKVNDGKTAIINTSDANGLIVSGDVTLGNAGSLIIAAGKNVNAADIKGSADKKGELLFQGASTVTSTIGNAVNSTLNKVTLENGQVNFVSDVYKAATTELTHANSDIKLSKAIGPIAVETNITTTANNQGKVTLDDGDVDYTGSIGAADRKVALVDLNGKELFFTGADNSALYATSITGAATSVISVEGASFIFDAKAGTANSKIDKVVILSNVAGNAAAIVQMKEGSEIHASLGIDLSNGNNQDNELHLYDNTIVGGKIVATDGDKGKVVVKGNSTVTGGIDQINQVIFDVADKTLKLGAPAAVDAVNGIDFQQNATLELTEATSTISIAADITIAQNANGLGIIKANALTSNTKSVDFLGAIGDVTATDKKLKLLEVKNGANIDLVGNSAIAKIDIGNADAKVTLHAAGQYFIGELVGSKDHGTVEIAQNVILKSGTTLGTSDNKRKEILLGNNTLTLNNKVDIYAGEIKGTAANNGVLDIEGESTIDAVIGNNAAIHEINVSGGTTVAGSTKTAQFKQKVNVTGDINIGNGATAEFAGDVSATNIKGMGNDLGTARFTNTAAKNIDAIIGAVRLQNVEIGGAGLTFKKDLQANSLTFTNSSKAGAEVKIEDATSLAATTIIASDHSAASKQGILFDKIDYDVTAAVGTAAKNFGYMKVSEGANNASKTLTISTNDFYANALTANHENNDVVFNSADAKVNNIGLVDKNFKKASFNGAKTTVSGNAWAKDMEVGAGKEVDFAKVVSGSGTFKFNNNSTVTVKDGGTWSIAAAGNAAGEGKLTFAGNAKINKVIGSTALNEIKFTGGADKSIDLNQDLTATKIAFEAARVNISDNRTLDGATDFNSTNIALGSSKLTLKGTNSKLSGTPTISIDIDEEGNSGGQILVEDITFDMNQATALNININDEAELPDANERSFELVKKKNTNATTIITSLADGKNVAFSQSRNGFVKWEFDRATNVLSQKNVAAQRLKAIVASKNNASLSKDAEILGNANNTGNAKAFASDMSKISDDKKIAEAVERITNPISSTTAIAERISDDVIQGQIRSRIAVVSAPTPGIQTADAGAIGVAAGDDHYLHGAWVMPFYSSFEQKSRSNSPGYEASSFGATLGADTQLNADLTIGIAATISKTDVKHKNAISGDKTKGNTYMFSMYGIQQITDNWFLQGSASIGSTSFKNTQKRIVSVANQTASGKFDASFYGGELLAGYNYHVDNMTFTPLIGASFNRFNDGGYTETGTSFQNLNIKKKSSNRLEAIAGARADFGAADMGEMTLKPEIHAFVRHDFISKDNKISINYDGIQNGKLSDKKYKPNNTHVNLGFGLNANSGQFDYGVGYDADLASKFIGHQGSLKFRVNF